MVKVKPSTTMETQEHEDQITSEAKNTSPQTPLTLSSQNSPLSSPCNQVEGLLESKKRSSRAIKVKISGPSLRCAAKRVHMEKQNDSVVERVVDGTDPRPTTDDPCVKENSSNERMMTDYILMSDNEQSNSPTSVVGLSQLLPDFENFEIIVNRSNVNPELSYEIRKKYFDLCSNRRSVLHSHFLSSVSAKLAAEIISNTTEISESLKDSKLKTCGENLNTWDKTLAGFEMLGMDVVFIRARINRLLGLFLESKKAVNKQRFKDVNVGITRIDSEMKGLELKIMEMKKVRRGLVNESEEIKGIAEKYRRMFQEEANEPW